MSRVTRLFRSAPAYPLLLPGMVWLAIFFFVPMYYLLDMSLRTGNLLDGFTQVYRFANYGDAIRDNKEQFIRSIIYAGSATVLAFCISYPLAYVIAFRGGRYKTSLLTFIPAIGDYINAYLLGSTQTTMIGNVIQSKFLTFNDYPSAAALSFTLMAGIMVFVIIYARILGTEDLA